ncbi:hypothetical protein DFJ74DRAFT_715035 [Hyaloraphidium curvatum]|nr:hypothetical protein DFJ74DRAFT_715035 [Hyaloraphidium curvatum]
MGNCFSSKSEAAAAAPRQAAVPVPLKQTAAVPAAPAPAAPTETPEPALPDTPNPPIPLAVFRNAHEGIRGAIRECDSALPSVPSFASAWHSFQRAMRVHARMEDDLMYPLLNAASDNKITKEGITEEHVKDHELGEKVEAAVADGDADKVKGAWEEYKAFHLAHLLHEEKVQPPLVAKIVPATPAGRAKFFHEKFITPIMAADADEFAFMIGYCVKMMTKYGTTEHDALTGVRVFVHGTKVACSPAQWDALRPVVEANTTPEIWKAMCSEYFVDTPGDQVAA